MLWILLLEYFNKIFEYFEKFGTDNLPENLKEIKEFLEMNYEQLIMKFYDSSEFNIFKEDNRISKTLYWR